MTTFPLKKFCDFYGLTPLEISQHTGISRNFIYQVLNGGQPISAKIWAFFESKYDKDIIESLRKNIELWHKSPELANDFVPDQYAWIKEYVDNVIADYAKAHNHRIIWKLQKVIEQIERDKAKNYLMSCVCGKDYVVNETELDYWDTHPCSKCGKKDWQFNGLIKA